MAEIVIKVNTEGGEKSLKNINDLKSAIGELEKEAANMDLGSDAFENQKNQIDELKKKYQELSKSQQQLDAETAQAAGEAASKRAEHMEKIGNNLQKFAAGITDAFAGAFIAMGATGKDAEEFNKTLQQGIGIAVGVKGGIEALVAGVELAGPAFEAFNAIMAANPIGAIVVVVAALVAGIYLLIKALNAEEAESEKLTRQLEEQKVMHESLSKARQSEISLMESKLDLMKAQGKSDSEILRATVELYEAKKKALEQDLVQLELAANITKTKLQETLANDTLTESYYKKSAAVARSLGYEQEAAILEKVAAAEKLKNSKEVRDQLLTDLTAVKELKDKIGQLDIQKEIEVTTIKKKINEDYQKDHISDSVKFKAKITEDNDEIHQQELDALEKIKDSNKSANELKLEEKAKTDAELLNLSAQAYSKEEKLYKDSQAAQAAASEEAFKAKVAKVQQYTAIIGSALNSIVGAFQAYQDLQRQNEEQDTKERQAALDAQLSSLEASRDAELAKEGLTANQKTAINQKYAQQEYNLKLLEYNRSTEVKKKAFEQDKKLKIATTVINTITGAVGALTGFLSSGIPMPAAGILGALAAAAVVATGALQVAAISNQKFDAGSPPTAPSIVLPSANAGGDNGGPGAGAQNGPQLYAAGGGDTNTGQGGQGQRQSQEPIKAYVVSQEVTSSQNMNNVIERRSSF